MMISQFEFNEAMNILVPNINKDHLYRLINELDDKTTNMISIAKFQKIYNTIVNESANSYGGRGGYDNSTLINSIFTLLGGSNKRRYNEMVDEITSSIKSKYFSADEFFSKFEYNKYAKVIPLARFEDALRELRLYYNQSDINILKTELDPNNSGRLDLAPILNARPDNRTDMGQSLQRQKTVTGQTLSQKDQEELDKLLEDIKVHTSKSKLSF